MGQKLKGNWREREANVTETRWKRDGDGKETGRR